MTLDRLEAIKARASSMIAPELAVAFVTAIEAFVGRTCDRVTLAETLAHRGLTVREAVALADLREALVAGAESAPPSRLTHPEPFPLSESCSICRNPYCDTPNGKH